jgi:hypothetical protein
MAAPEPTAISESMRSIRKYLVQAKQLDKINPQIAYFCRSHACQQGLKLKSTPEDLDFVMSLLDWLEANNSIVQNIPQASRQVCSPLIPLIFSIPIAILSHITPLFNTSHHYFLSSLSPCFSPLASARISLTNSQQHYLNPQINKTAPLAQHKILVVPFSLLL